MKYPVVAGRRTDRARRPASHSARFVGIMSAQSGSVEILRASTPHDPSMLEEHITGEGARLTKGSAQASSAACGNSGQLKQPP
jgi:hypothetical protein